MTVADELAKLIAIRASGELIDDEFAVQKARLFDPDSHEEQYSEGDGPYEEDQYGGDTDTTLTIVRYPALPSFLSVGRRTFIGPGTSGALNERESSTFWNRESTSCSQMARQPLDLLKC